MRELLVEFLKRREIEFPHEKLVANTAEESLDLSLGGGVPHGGMAEDTADAGADERNLLTAIDRTVVDQQLLRNASFVERGADRLDHRIGVLLEEEFAVTQHATGVIDEGDQFGLSSLNVGAEHGIGLP